jgi:hypothetical protein
MDVSFIWKKNMKRLMLHTPYGTRDTKLTHRQIGDILERSDLMMGPWTPLSKYK